MIATNHNISLNIYINRKSNTKSTVKPKKLIFIQNKMFYFSDDRHNILTNVRGYVLRWAGS